MRMFLALIILSAFAMPRPAQANLQCSTLAQLFDTYLKQHYQYHKLNDTLRSRTVDQFIKESDPSKTIYLQSDVDKVHADLLKNFNAIEQGNCKSLQEINRLQATRAKENEDFVRSFVGPDYKLDETIELVLDPKKRAFAKNMDEKKDILRKLVHFQMSNYLLSDVKMKEARQHLIHRYELITKRIKERKMEDVLASYVESFALSLDPHSSFLSRDNLEDFQIQMQLSLEGIGASLTSQDGFTVIEELIPGGGAEKSNLLRPKDKIIAVAQDGQKPVSVIDMDLRDVVKMIRGRKGTKVKLTILRQGAETKTFEATIVRDKIDIKDQAAKITYEKRKVGAKTYKVGVIDLPSFYGGGGAGTRSCSVDMKKMLFEAMHKEKVDGLVLDLSRNGGGLLEEAVKIAGLFVHHGRIVATKDTQTNIQILADQDEDVFYNGPLVVLTSRLSASASEILAGALRDYKRALIVGADHTFGKGSVQVVSNLPMEIGGMKVTTGMFFLPGGKSTQNIGVPSDILLPSVYNNEEIGEGALDYPLPPQSIQAFLSPQVNPPGSPKHWLPVDDGEVKKLSDKSRDRVAKEPKFAEIRKAIEESVKNGSVAKLADLRKKSAEETKKEKKEKKHKKHKKPGEKDELEAPLVQESVNILIDWLQTRTAA